MIGGRSIDGGIDEIPLPVPAGRLWLCGKHVVGPGPEAVLDRVGATTIVCLNQTHELTDRYPDYVEWLRHNTPGRVVWFPTPDLSMRAFPESHPFLMDLIERLQKREGLIVHCAAGIGRSGTTATALLMLLGVDSTAALDTVARHRPMAGPEAGSQRGFIEELQTRLSSGGRRET